MTYKNTLKKVGEAAISDFSEEEVRADPVRFFNISLDAMRAAHKARQNHSYPRKATAADFGINT